MTQERVPLPNSIDPENLTMDSLDWDKDQIFSSSQLVDLAGSFVDQIKLLNELIETYNSVLVDEILRILSEIEQLTQTIRDKYPSNFLTGIKNYQENIRERKNSLELEQEKDSATQPERAARANRPSQALRPSKPVPQRQPPQASQMLAAKRPLTRSRRCEKKSEVLATVHQAGLPLLP
jgi:hypothetical protein